MCGAAKEIENIISGLQVSMPHAALCVVQQSGLDGIREPFRFQCRTRLCGWCNHEEGFGYVCLLLVSMPHAALWVVQPAGIKEAGELVDVSMPHAALCVVQPSNNRTHFRVLPVFQCRTRLCGWCSLLWSDSRSIFNVVSMPHAALCVVQRSLHRLYHSRDYAK